MKQWYGVIALTLTWKWGNKHTVFCLCLFLSTTSVFMCELKFQFAVIPFCMKNFPTCEPDSDAIVHGPFCSLEVRISSAPSIRVFFPYPLCVIIKALKSIFSYMSRLQIYVYGLLEITQCCGIMLLHHIKICYLYCFKKCWLASS